MSDYISRQAAIDAILRNQEVYSNNFGNDPIDKYTIAIIDNDAQTIAQLPSAQPEPSDAVYRLYKRAYEAGQRNAQPEIIRCKDCKHYQFADNRAFGMPVKMCEWFGFEDVDDDDFCSFAERRSDE